MDQHIITVKFAVPGNPKFSGSNQEPDIIGDDIRTQNTDTPVETIIARAKMNITRCDEVDVAIISWREGG